MLFLFNLFRSPECNRQHYFLYKTNQIIFLIIHTKINNFQALFLLFVDLKAPYPYPQQFLTLELNCGQKF